MRISELIQLFEDRETYIAQQMKGKLEAAAERDRNNQGAADSLAIVKRLRQMDPDAQGKNVQWLARMYSANQFSLEDINNIKRSVGVYLAHRRDIAVKDLNAVKSLAELYQLIKPFEGREGEVSRGQELRGQADKIVDTPNFKVVVPKTEAASCKYGAGTRWCTSGREDNQFDYYSKQGSIYIIIARIGGQQRKFQLHVESDQFMDEEDQNISKGDIAALSAIPQYTEFLNWLIKKHYSQYLDQK